MTMVPRTRPSGEQTLRPACSSWRSCAPNGLTSPNTFHVHVGSCQPWRRVSSGRLSANRLTSMPSALNSSTADDTRYRSSAVPCQVRNALSVRIPTSGDGAGTDT